MKTIWKYALQIEDYQTIAIPAGAQLLCVQVQGEFPYLWAMVDSGNPQEERGILMYGTGHECAENTGAYLGTFQRFGGDLVFHVFEAKEPT